jgi:replicative DNA helicase
MNQPIAALEAERLLVGGVLKNGALLDEARAALAPRDFFDGQMRRIFSLLCEMGDEGRSLDESSFLQFVVDRKLEGEMLIAAASDAASAAMWKRSVSEYIAEVREAAQKRGIATLGYELTERAYGREESAQELIAEADRRLLDIAAESVAQEASLEEQTIQSLSRIDAKRRGEVAACYRTGIQMLDIFAGGLGIGELTIVGGRPSMGKSCCVSQVVITNCPYGHACHVVSIEMTADELLARIWAALSGVPAGRICDPRYMSDEDAAKVREVALEVAKWPLVIDDGAVVTTDQMLSRARVVKRRINTAVIAVDYLQRINFPGSKQDRYMHVGDAAKRLAEFAKAEKCAALLLSSLTEKTGSGANIPPGLTDLRESGDIQYHAHKAYLIHRDRDEASGILPATKLIVAKNRHGRTGVVDATFNTKSLLFEDLEGARSHVM